MDTQNKILSENLKRLMEEKGVRQYQVADAIGVTAPTFNQYVTGKICPRMNKVQSIADYFGVKVSDITDKQINSTEAERLVIIYEQLNDEGKERLMEQAQFLFERYGK